MIEIVQIALFFMERVEKSQQILSQNEWYALFTPEDFRALTPLIHNHINPYENFDLDMDSKIPICI